MIERILIYLPIFEMYSVGPGMGLTAKKSDAFRYTRQEAEAIVNALPVDSIGLRSLITAKSSPPPPDALRLPLGP